MAYKIEDIDWSKMPEGATEFSLEDGDFFFTWYDDNNCCLVSELSSEWQDCKNNFDDGLVRYKVNDYFPSLRPFLMRNIMNKLKYYFEWAVDTWFGFMYTPSKYSKEWDKKLNQILDTRDYRFDEHVMYYKNYEVWISNRFYSYGSLLSKDRRWVSVKYRPKVSTMVRLAMLQDERNEKNVKTKEQTTLEIIRSIEIGELK